MSSTGNGFPKTEEGGVVASTPDHLRERAGPVRAKRKERREEGKGGGTVLGMTGVLTVTTVSGPERPMKIIMDSHLRPLRASVKTGQKSVKCHVWTMTGKMRTKRGLMRTKTRSIGGEAVTLKQRSTLKREGGGTIPRREKQGSRKDGVEGGERVAGGMGRAGADVPQREAMVSLFSVGWQSVSTDVILILCIIVESSEREQGTETGREWQGVGRRGGGRGGGKEGDRRGGGKREREGERSHPGRDRRRGNPPSESAWSRGKPHSLATRDRDETRELPPPKKYEEPVQPVSVHYNYHWRVIKMSLYSNRPSVSRVAMLC